MQYVIGIGTNLGEKNINIDNALKFISAKLTILKISNIYRSKALLKPNSPKEWNKDFFNLAILIDYMNTASKLLKTLKLIEKKMGRKLYNRKWSPRIIDFDILIAKDFTIKKKYLQIPHKELLNRNFALIPATEVAPNFIHPETKNSLKTHCDKIKNLNKVIC